MQALTKLLEIASDGFCDRPVQSSAPWLSALSDVDRSSMLWVLQRKNGFCAFGSALVVRPSHTVPGLMGIDDWNRDDGWKRFYAARASGTVFFAEDLFAGQFGLNAGGVVKLEPETGDLTLHSPSFEGWATKILDDYDYETGWSLARDWQREKGQLPLGYRLLPKQPFVLGGEYSVQNLVAVPGSQAMEKLGSLYNQIRTAPDGEKITVHGWLDFD